MDNNQFLSLVTKYFTGTISPDDNDLLQRTIADNSYYKNKFLLLEQYWTQHDEKNIVVSQQAFERVLEKINTDNQPAKRRSKWYQIAVAAMIAGLIITFGLVYIFYPKPKQGESSVATITTQKNDISPGKDRAVLTMADGTKVDLDSLQNNTLLGDNFQKKNDNELLVNAGSDREIKYNTLSTPQGGKYKVALPDGSTVWLNAASALYFPTAFTGNKREVTLTGEAYFEIARNEKQPFFVKVKNMEVAVLGTQFNVMAYDNENTINTTLLEGSVKVMQGAGSNYLKPGQQSMLDGNGLMKIREADIEEVMAWKNDLFVFKGCDFDKVMRQIARWYDVAIVYKGRVPSGRYSGVMGRNNNVSDVFKVLKSSGVSFKIEDRKIIIE